MRRKTSALTIFIVVLAIGGFAFAHYAALQYQRARMKTTITRMRALGTVLDAQRNYVGTCEEARKSMNAALQCTDAYGAPLHLRQSADDPARYVIWCQGNGPETARFIYTPEGFTRVPKDAPP